MTHLIKMQKYTKSFSFLLDFGTPHTRTHIHVLSYASNAFKSLICNRIMNEKWKWEKTLDANGKMEGEKKTEYIDGDAAEPCHGIVRLEKWVPCVLRTRYSLKTTLSTLQTCAGAFPLMHSQITHQVFSWNREIVVKSLESTKRGIVRENQEFSALKADINGSFNANMEALFGNQL